LRPVGLAPLTFDSDEQIARNRALMIANDPDVAQSTTGYTGSQYGRYSPEERRAAKAMVSMHYNRPSQLRFQGGRSRRSTRRSARRRSTARRSSRRTRRRSTARRPIMRSRRHSRSISAARRDYRRRGYASKLSHFRISNGVLKGQDNTRQKTIIFRG